MIQRAARQPKLAIVVAAWQQYDGKSADTLLVRLEEAVGEAMNLDERGSSSGAWAALDLSFGGAFARERHDEPTQTWASGHQDAGRAAAAVGGRPNGPAAKPATSGPRCYECGQRGHIQRECPSRSGGRGQHEELMAKLNELTEALRGMQMGSAPRKEKNA